MMNEDKPNDGGKAMGIQIPSEAIEVAAKALYFYLDEDHRGTPAPWESLADDDEAKIDAMEAARIAFEAAAPYMSGSTVELQWGVRDRSSLVVAGHPSEESARGTVAVRPEWYEVVSRPRPKPQPRWEVQE